MEATIVHDRPSDNVEIYYASDRHYAILDGNGQIQYLNRDPGERFPPMLRLDFPTYEAIMRAALGPTPTDDVLRDARNVRDRLLTLVEKAWRYE